ncbi:MAG: sigma-70 family RNA polymerase sigma factor [Solirubrobacteraceae bacterium]
MTGPVSGGRANEALAARDALRVLSERDRQILYLRFVKEMSQGKIAAHLGVSQMQVSRLLRRCLDQLRVVAGAA